MISIFSTVNDRIMVSFPPIFSIWCFAWIRKPITCEWMFTVSLRSNVTDVPGVRSINCSRYPDTSSGLTLFENFQFFISSMIATPSLLYGRTNPH